MNVRHMMVMPRYCVLSATQVEAMVTRNERKKGGAVSPWALTKEKPMSFKIVGRKTGSEKKPTLQLKYIRAVN